MHGDYGKFDNLEDVSFGFQLVNRVSFDIKNSVLKIVVYTSNRAETH